MTEEEIAERDLAEEIRKMNEINEAMQAVEEKPKKGKGKILPPVIEAPITKPTDKTLIVKKPENTANSEAELRDILSAFIKISAILQSV